MGAVEGSRQQKEGKAVAEESPAEAAVRPAEVEPVVLPEEEAAGPKVVLGVVTDKKVRRSRGSQRISKHNQRR